MGTHNICLYKEVYKNYTGCNLKATELLDCAFIGAGVVIRSNTVFVMSKFMSNRETMHQAYLDQEEW